MVRQWARSKVDGKPGAFQIVKDNSSVQSDSSCCQCLGLLRGKKRFFSTSGCIFVRFINRQSCTFLEWKTLDSSVCRSPTMISVLKLLFWFTYRTSTTSWSWSTFSTQFSLFCGRRTIKLRSFTFTTTQEWWLSHTRKLLSAFVTCSRAKLQIPFQVHQNTFRRRQRDHFG